MSCNLNTIRPFFSNARSEYLRLKCVCQGDFVPSSARLSGKRLCASRKSLTSRRSLCVLTSTSDNLRYVMGFKAWAGYVNQTTSAMPRYETRFAAPVAASSRGRRFMENKYVIVELRVRLRYCLIVRQYEIVTLDAPLLEITKHAALLRQQVENALRQAIIDGQLRPGQKLTERELTARMGVSRTLIREALRQLESEGLITVIPNRGPVVRMLTATEVEELYDIRAVLEGLAARRFAQNADAPTLELLGKASADVIAAYQAGRPARALEAKNRFYEILVTGAGSESLSTMLATLHARIRQWRAIGMTHPQRSPNRAEEAVDGLNAIWSAIRKRDAIAAESATRDEARRGAAELMRLLAAVPAKQTAQM